MLPPRSLQLVESTPIHRLERGTKVCLELTVYPDGHAGIAVSEIEGSPPSRRIVQRDSLPLNSVDELRDHVLAIIDHLDAATRGSEAARGSSAARDAGWSVTELERELRRFKRELEQAGLKESSIDTYVQRTSIFLRWLVGEYQPHGPR